MSDDNNSLTIPIGNKIIIIPFWMDSPDPTRIPISIKAGAFGSGSHPTTRLCLELLEKYIQPGMDVIDIGCGSGILSIGALKLGAGRALAVDIEDDAVQISEKNAQENNVMSGFLSGTGSVVEIVNGKFALRNAPILMVNILANTIMHLFSDGLAQLISKNGILILSGIKEDQMDILLEKAADYDLKMIEKQQIQDWVALVLG